MPSFTNVTDHGSRCTHGIPYYWGRSTKVRSRTTRYLLDLARYLKGTRYLAKVTVIIWPRYTSISGQGTGTPQYLTKIQVPLNTWHRYRYPSIPGQGTGRYTSIPGQGTGTPHYLAKVPCPGTYSEKSPGPQYSTVSLASHAVMKDLPHSWGGEGRGGG